MLSELWSNSRSILKRYKIFYSAGSHTVTLLFCKNIRPTRLKPPSLRSTENLRQAHSRSPPQNLLHCTILPTSRLWCWPCLFAEVHEIQGLQRTEWKSDHRCLNLSGNPSRRSLYYDLNKARGLDDGMVQYYWYQNHMKAKKTVGKEKIENKECSIYLWNGELKTKFRTIIVMQDWPKGIFFQRLAEVPNTDSYL